jgi:hypothetical protein
MQFLCQTALHQIQLATEQFDMASVRHSQLYGIADAIAPAPSAILAPSWFKFARAPI